MSMINVLGKPPEGVPNEPLSFEAFAKREGSFHMFFAGEPGKKHMDGDLYRSEPVYQDCLAEHPELRVLTIELQGYKFTEFGIDETTGAPIIKNVDPKREEMMRKLYSAYLIMRPYAKRDGELFG